MLPSKWHSLGEKKYIGLSVSKRRGGFILFVSVRFFVLFFLYSCFFGMNEVT